MRRQKSWNRIADRSHARMLPLTPRLVETIRGYERGNRTRANEIADAVYLAAEAGAELPRGVVARLAALRRARGPEAVTDALLDLADYAHDVLSASEAYYAAVAKPIENAAPMQAVPRV